MKRASETVAGTVLIAAVVAAGVWYARDPENRPGVCSFFSAASPDAKPPNLAAIDHFNWSADGQKLLVRFYDANAGGICLSLHELGRPTACIPIDVPGESVSAAALAPDNFHVLVGTYQGHVWWIEPKIHGTATLLVDLPTRTFVTSAAITGDGRLIGIGTNSGLIYLCDPAQSMSAILTTNSPSAVRDLHFSIDGLRLVSAQANGRVSLWVTATGELSQEFAGHDEISWAADFLADGKRVITAGPDDTVRIWDIADGRELWRGEFGMYGVNALAVSPDGNTAAWGGYSRKIVVWDLDRHRKKFEIATSAPSVLHLQFSPDGTTLAASGQEEVIRLYDVRTAAEKTGIEVVGPVRL